MKSKMLFALFAGLLVCGTLFAHHGTGISYDTSKSVELKGTVTEFVWKNPHAHILFDVKDAGGNVVKWAAEGSSHPRSSQDPSKLRRSAIGGHELFEIHGPPGGAGHPVTHGGT